MHQHLPPVTERACAFECTHVAVRHPSCCPAHAQRNPSLPDTPTAFAPKYRTSPTKVTIILLNLLISIISESYERIRENERWESLRNKALLIVESETQLYQFFLAWLYRTLTPPSAPAHGEEPRQDKGKRFLYIIAVRDGAGPPFRWSGRGCVGNDGCRRSRSDACCGCKRMLRGRGLFASSRRAAVGQVCSYARPAMPKGYRNSRHFHSLSF